MHAGTWLDKILFPITTDGTRTWLFGMDQFSFHCLVLPSGQHSNCSLNTQHTYITVYITGFPRLPNSQYSAWSHIDSENHSKPSHHHGPSNRHTHTHTHTHAHLASLHYVATNCKLKLRQKPAGLQTVVKPASLYSINNPHIFLLKFQEKYLNSAWEALSGEASVNYWWWRGTWWRETEAVKVYMYTIYMYNKNRDPVDMYMYVYMYMNQANLWIPECLLAVYKTVLWKCRVLLHTATQ